MTNENYVDIKKQIRLTPDELEFIKENPAGLTKEGCMQEIKNWKRSRNKYTKKMYDVMLVSCKNFTASGKTSDGKTIMSKDKDGRVTWSEKVD